MQRGLERNQQTVTALRIDSDEDARHRFVALTSSVRISFWVKSLDVAHLVRKPSKLEMLMSIIFCTNSHCCKAFCKLRCCSSLLVISSFIVWRAVGVIPLLHFHRKKNVKKRERKKKPNVIIQKGNVEEPTEQINLQSAMKGDAVGLQERFEPWHRRLHCNNTPRSSCCFIKVSLAKSNTIRRLQAGLRGLPQHPSGAPSFQTGF